MSEYSRMLLVRPDMIQNPKADDTTTTAVNAQTDYFETQALRERLSPHASLVNFLLHLQKRANSVLNDPTLKTNRKLSMYDQLMTRSGILIKKG